MELHASKKARVRLALDDFHYSVSGTLLLPDFDASRLLAERLNRNPDPARPGAPPVKAWQLHAMGLINEIFQYLVGLYRESRKPSATREALSALREAMGTQRVDSALAKFVETFPPPGAPDPDAAAAFLDGEGPALPRRELILQEEMVLWLANLNPAFSPGLPLFDDTVLEKEAAYRSLLDRLHRFFDALPPFGPEDQNLVDMLRAPALAHPDSLYGQLEFIWKRWGYLLGRFRHLHRLLSALDWIREEETKRAGGGGRVTAPVLEFAGLRGEAEQFSQDRDWMPRLVVLAKNTYVWLEQLSRRHGRWIQRLDQVPDEELDEMRRRGFSGLWLIGLWERSAASAEIKRLRGGQDTVASAYSLHDYTIASDLGGEAALESLKARAWQRGIRLASDMVPNHMGIDSRWVRERPDWFLSREHSPYPSYTFGGPDLSRDSRVGIFIEDHYYQETDAAVVFKRVDRSTGSERYLYHGNDGTSTPWNDTAQLNYLNPEVREGVIAEILRVARQFPVIRFDAAMTLAKRHYQRLWFPEPGTGGAIPSRAEFGLTRDQFDAQMPREFWREVVDRVAREAPDTLLLAEAFWMMEGYFVRTLGMHRVYNSAFMNMLRDEENAKYRSVIKNTLEFDPQVLRRYVNFMNNPDEDPAAEAFGKGDKYFGICTLLAALPGLPMFGHGQWEGFREKYGMEFRRPRLNEAVDEELAARHDREISPLLRRRDLFAGVENFLLYDFFTPEGQVDENVFAFSNGIGARHGLVLFQNRFASTRGWIRTSAAFARKGGGAGAAGLIQRGLGEGLGLTPAEGRFAVYRDLSTNLEHLQPSREICERGLYSELHAYQCRVLLDVRELRDGEDGALARLCAELEGRGVPDLELALRELRFRPIRVAFRKLAGAEMFRRILEARPKRAGETPDPLLLKEIEEKGAALLSAIRRHAPASGRSRETAKDARQAVGEAGQVARDHGQDGAQDDKAWVRELRDRLGLALDLRGMEKWFPPPLPEEYRAAARDLLVKMDSAPYRWSCLVGWAVAQSLEGFTTAGGAPGSTIVPGVSGVPDSRRTALEKWGLVPVLSETLRGLGRDEAGASRDVEAMSVIVRLGRWWERESPAREKEGKDAKAIRGRPPGRKEPLQRPGPGSPEERARRLLERLSADEKAREILGFNRHQEILYLNKEALADFLSDLLAASAVEIGRGSADGGANTVGELPLRFTACHASLQHLLQTAVRAGYQVEVMRQALEELPPPPHNSH